VTLERKKLFVERGIGIAVLVFVLVAPQLVSGFWMDAILSQSFILGIGAASLVFLSAYGGMISLAQAGLMGIAGYALGNMVTERVEGGDTKGLLLGWDPTVSVVAAILLTVGIGILFGAVASRSFGIYFLMLTLTYSVIAFLFVSQVTQVGGFSPIAECIASIITCSGRLVPLAMSISASFALSPQVQVSSNASMLASAPAPLADLNSTL